MPAAAASSSAWRCASTPIRSGTATCRRPGPASSTATGCTDPIAPKRGTASTRTSCSSTRTRRTSPAPCAGATPSSAIPIGHRRADLSFDRRDSASGMPKSKVIDPAFSWGDDRRPSVPWSEMVIYETHVRGFTRLHPEVPPPLRGTYAGLACAGVVEYLRRLGVTTIELMPVHAFVDDRHLVERGLTNYWGYNTIGFFAPDMRYAASHKVSRVQDHGEDAALGRDRGDPRRRLQPHRRGQRARADALASAASTTPPTTGCPPTTAATTSITPAAATPSTWCTRACCSSSWTACATGCSRCTSTASASTSPRRSRASCTRSTGWARSSTSCARTRC